MDRIIILLAKAMAIGALLATIFVSVYAISIDWQRNWSMGVVAAACAWMIIKVWECPSSSKFVFDYDESRQDR